jgi:uracil phosphoribosyltransferase
MRTLVVDHPLIGHKLTALRDADTEAPTFRRLADELVTLLAYEATREVRVQAVSVKTPVGPAEGIKLARPVPLVVPILRAGIGSSTAWPGCCRPPTSASSAWCAMRSPSSPRSTPTGCPRI